MTRTLMIVAAVLLAASALVRAEQAPAPPAPQGAATVRAVQGTVETRPTVGQPWAPVKVGMTLAEGADLRTGFRALCILDLTGSLVQMDPLTVLRIGEARREGDTFRTRLIMKQGNAQAAVEKERFKSDFAIVTPSATLSVRGTHGIQCGFFPVFGGQYGLANSGLLHLANTYWGFLTFLRPGEYTNDDAWPPALLLLFRTYLPVLMAHGGYQPHEMFAAWRWHTSMPFLGGFQGSSGLPILRALMGGQEIGPITPSCDGDTEPQEPPEPIDITKPPPDYGEG